MPVLPEVGSTRVERPGAHRRVLEVEVLTVEAEHLLRQRRLDDLDRLRAEAAHRLQDLVEAQIQVIHCGRWAAANPLSRLLKLTRSRNGPAPRQWVGGGRLFE